VSFPTLQRHQRADANLQRTARNNPATFRTVDYGTSSLLQSRQHPNSQSWKIVVPVAVVDEVIKWFHDTLMHPGVQRMLQTIRKHFYFPQMRRRVEEYVRHCDSCQRTKNHHDRAGLLPPKDPETDPWCEVQVDLMGPWQVDVGYNYRLTIHALSCVDPFTGYIEIVRVSNTLSAHVSSKFHNHWLCRYPTPSRCIHDNGPEFVGHEFQDVLRYYGIKDCPTTSKILRQILLSREPIRPLLPCSATCPMRLELIAALASLPKTLTILLKLRYPVPNEQSMPLCTP
jgi:hypothetical protein